MALLPRCGALLVLAVCMASARADIIDVGADTPVAAGLRAVGEVFRRTAGHNIHVHEHNGGTATESLDLEVTGGAAGQAPTGAEASAVLDLGRMGLGFAAAAGTPPLDLGSPEAVRAALRGTPRFITVAGASSPGQRLLTRLGLAPGASDGRWTAVDSPAQALEVLSQSPAGSLALLTRGDFAAWDGVDLPWAGPLPPELQEYTRYQLALTGKGAARPVVAAFVQYLRQPGARIRLTAFGLE